MQLNMLVFLNHLFNNSLHQIKKERKTWKKTYKYFVFFFLNNIRQGVDTREGKGRKEKLSSTKGSNEESLLFHTVV
jgi:hypothetical protein